LDSDRVAEFTREELERRLVQVTDNRPPALGRHPAGDRSANPGGAAG